MSRARLRISGNGNDLGESDTRAPRRRLGAAPQLLAKPASMDATGAERWRKKSHR